MYCITEFMVLRGRLRNNKCPFCIAPAANHAKRFRLQHSNWSKWKTERRTTFETINDDDKTRTENHKYHAQSFWYLNELHVTRRVRSTTNPFERRENERWKRRQRNKRCLSLVHQRQSSYRVSIKWLFLKWQHKVINIGQFRHSIRLSCSFGRSDHHLSRPIVQRFELEWIPECFNEDPFHRPANYSSIKSTLSFKVSQSESHLWHFTNDSNRIVPEAIRRRPIDWFAVAEQRIRQTINLRYVANRLEQSELFCSLSSTPLTSKLVPLRTKVIIDMRPYLIWWFDRH